tara:strand:- start:3593 stop:3886 length:294 start_codon:yes stop_codon:yes gene_type:complete
VLLTVHIPNEAERIAFACDIKHILKTAKVPTQDYIPGHNNGCKADIGIKATNLNLEILAQVVSQIERRGYSVESTKGPAELNLSLSASSPREQQKTT